MKYRDKISLADASFIALTYQVEGIVIREILKDKHKLFEIQLCSISVIKFSKG